jgi:hypothetical protein
MAISSAINDLVSSVYELFASVLGGIYTIFHTIFAAVYGLFSGVINLFADVFKGAIDVVGGLGKFLASKFLSTLMTPDPQQLWRWIYVQGGGAVGERGERLYTCEVPSADGITFYDTGNIVIVAIIAAGGYAFMRYSQGRPIAPAAQKKVQ